MAPERMADYRKSAAAISPSIGTPPLLLPVGSEVELYPATFSGRLAPIKRQLDNPALHQNLYGPLSGCGCWK